MDIFASGVNTNGFPETIRHQQFVLNAKVHIGIHRKKRKCKITENIPLFSNKGFYLNEINKIKKMVKEFHK